MKSKNLLAIIAIFYLSSVCIGRAQSKINKESKTIQPVIMVCDLMRPYDDPDDHWDLATAFALTYTGAFDLKGIIIDSPINKAYIEQKNPDISAVAMLNYLTGLHVPVTTGSPYPLQNKTDKQLYAPIKDLGGVNFIYNTLSESKEKVKVVITGSSRDVAIAINRFPELFEEKCNGIYLNAGLGLDNPYEKSRPGWNPKLDTEAFHTIFHAPCPVFWLPCNVSHYLLKHGNVFPYMSKNMQKFFTFMYEKQPAENWFQFLQEPLNDSTINALAEKHRSMFCTVSFFHAAGFFIDESGKTVQNKFNHQVIADFVPIKIDELNGGFVKYSVITDESNIKLLEVKNEHEFYSKNTEEAIKNLLKWFP